MGIYYKNTAAWMWNEDTYRNQGGSKARRSLCLSLFSLSDTHTVSLGVSVSLCSVLLLSHRLNLRGILMVSSVSTLPCCLCTRLPNWSLASTLMEL